LNDWTAKVDFKASIVLALEVGVLGLVVTLSGDKGPLHQLSGWHVIAYRAGVGALFLGALLGMGVVIPQLNRRRTRKTGQEWHTNTIYFGHLRHWDDKALTARLNERQDSVEQLSRQLIAMSRIAWRKHSLLQVSMISLAVGAALVTSSAVF
jgi:hypothetical protein